MGCHPAGFGHGRFPLSLEEEIEMLEKAKEHHEAALKNINERLEKLKE
jgi:hypothetical protein